MKNKRTRNMVILLIALILCAGLAVFATKQQEKREAAETEESQEMIEVLSMDPADLTSVHWAYGRTEFAKLEETMTKQGDGTWLFDEDHSLPVDQEAVQRFLDAICHISAYKKTDLTVKEAGLDEPYCTVELKGRENLNYYFGDMTLSSGNVYFTMEDGIVYVVPNVHKVQFGKLAKDFEPTEEEEK